MFCLQTALVLWIYWGVGRRKESNDNTIINKFHLLSVCCRTGFQVCSILYLFYLLNNLRRQDHGAFRKEHSTLRDGSLDGVKANIRAVVLEAASIRGDLYGFVGMPVSHRVCA